MSVVALTDAEAEFAALVAFRRQIENLRRGRRNAHGAEVSRGWDYHVRGALGEAVVASWAGVPWSGNLGDLSADDVGSLQVRTRARITDDLMIQPNDKADRRYLLVVPAPGVLTYRIVGWIMGRDGRDPQFWGDPYGTGRPAYWVPQAALRPMPPVDVVRATLA